MHMGLDFGYTFGNDVPAVCAGWITSSTDNGGGNPMAAGPKSVVQHCGDWLVLYGHMSATYSGFKNAGEIVGKSGDPSGSAGGGNNHLHLEVRQKQGSTTYSNRAVNPVPLFTNKNGVQANDKIVCGDPGNQPDVTYGSINKCTIWCGCPAGRTC
jgi:murein DD-endopeptidase MepM/ murein hydrolase activator NlpD